MRIFFLTRLLILIIPFYACKSQSLIANSGQFINRSSFYDSAKNSYFVNQSKWPDTRYWYKDHLAIELQNELKIVEKNGVVVEKKIVPKYYIFIDINNMYSYTYLNFSDTAKIFNISKFDRAKPNDITTNLGVDNIKIKTSQPPINLSDTTIEGVSYKRVKYVLSMGETGGDKIRIGYFRCDLQHFKFPFFKSISDSIGCPMLIFENYSPKAKTGQKTELLFLSNTLSENELKVFNAWEKNAKNNPPK